MKKHLLTLIALVALSSIAFAQKFESEGIYYNITSSTEPYTVEVTYKNATIPFNDSTTYAGDIIIPSSVTYEGNTYAVTAIGNDAFSSSSLSNVTIPNTIDSIGSNAFSWCSNLTNVTIPNSVTFIGDFAFLPCSGLTQFDVAADNVFFSDVEGVLFNKVQDVLIQYPIAKPDTSYVIPNTVTGISNAAFTLCSNLTNITIPNSVTAVGYYAFYECRDLTSMTIPNSLTYIGGSAFASCSKLTQFEVAAGSDHFNTIEGVLCNKTLDTLVIYPMAKGTSYIIPNSITAIDNYAFIECNNLVSVIISDAVTAIGRRAFAGCSGLTSMTIKAVVPPIFSRASTFSNVSTDIPVYVPCQSLEDYQTAEVWSEFTNIQCDATGIAEVTTFPYEVYTRNNTLIIKQAEGQPVVVFDMMGRTIFQTTATGETTYTLPTAGVYVVRVAEGFAKKIVVD